MSVSYNICLTPEFSHECVCKYSAEYLRSCAHVIAAIRDAYRNTKLEACNMWYYRRFIQIWNAKTLLRQHAHPIKRSDVKGEELYQTALLLVDLPRKPERKWKRPYEYSCKQTCDCIACGLVGTSRTAVQILTLGVWPIGIRNKTEKVADSAIAALTQHEQERQAELSPLLNFSTVEDREFHKSKLLQKKTILDALLSMILYKQLLRTYFRQAEACKVGA